MTAEQWRRIKVLFDSALGHDPGRRETFLREACAGDDGLYGEVVGLLQAGMAADALWGSKTSTITAGEPVDLDPMEGRRIGPYRILQRIGSGGMGSVYRATRDDAEFYRVVAIKIIRPNTHQENAVRRFLHERQTLAALDHPQIVKLLDGGTTDDGLPYFVMDYVEGQAIHEYCSRAAMPISDRLELFRKVCAAVHYAHQNLVVHRDLKPNNILVTADGNPKLLDFGIAKLLKPEYSQNAIGLTLTAQPMTPEYASPEQILGQPITTASDIYSLGVLLYLMLTGQHPYKRELSSAPMLEQAICEKEPERPSSARGRIQNSSVEKRRLPGDLDVIVLKAMRKEPQRRYPSVEHFSEDIRRYLEGMPVVARNDTLAYRVGKFATRHKTGVAIGLAVALALLISTIVSIGYARVATRERERAERRFQDSRQLALFVVREFDDAMRQGATSARQNVVRRALETLNRLAGEAGDESLQRDLIEGYFRVGDLQGNFYGPNLGDLNGARESYRKALDISRQLHNRHPNDMVSRRDLARAYHKVGEVLALGGEPVAALEEYGKALQIFEAAAADHPGDRQALRDLLALHEKMGLILYEMSDLGGALEHYGKYLDLAGELQAASGGAWDERRAVAKGNLRAGEIAASCGQAEPGTGKIRVALATFQELNSMDPANVPVRRDLASTYLILGESLQSFGRSREALENFRQGFRLAEALSREDPQNRQFQRDVHLAAAFLASAAFENSQNREARLFYQLALQLAGTLATQTQASEDDHRNYAWLLLTTRFPDLKKPGAARLHAEKAVEMSKGRDAAALHMLALAYEAVGEWENALAAEEKVAALLPPVLSASCTPHRHKEMAELLTRLRSRVASRTAVSVPAPAGRTPSIAKP